MTNSTVELATASFILPAIERMSLKLESGYMPCAKLVLATDGMAPANQIWKAMMTRVNTRRKLQVIDKAANTKEASEMVMKPEMFLSFLQSVSNSMCWVARSAKRTLEEQAANDIGDNVDFTAIANGANEIGTGVDYAEQRLEDMGLDGLSYAHISEQLDEDFRTLMVLQSMMYTKVFSYLGDVEDLALFQIRSQDEDGNWFVEATAMDFDEAQPLMDRVAEEAAERSEAEDTEFGENFDFSNPDAMSHVSKSSAKSLAAQAA